MIEEMELKRQRIDAVLALIDNDMRVEVDGMGEGMITCIFAYSVDVRVRLVTGQAIDTTAFEVTPLERNDAIEKKHGSNESRRTHQRTLVSTGTIR